MKAETKRVKRIGWVVEERDDGEWMPVDGTNATKRHGCQNTYIRAIQKAYQQPDRTWKEEKRLGYCRCVPVVLLSKADYDEMRGVLVETLRNLKIADSNIFGINKDGDTKYYIKDVLQDRIAALDRLQLARLKETQRLNNVRKEAGRWTRGQQISLDQLARQDAANYPQKRLLYEQLRQLQGKHFSGIVGPRGAGKTVLLKQLAVATENSFYLSLDTTADYDLFDLAKQLQETLGVTTLLIDEIHFQQDYDGKLKKIYDFPDRTIFAAQAPNHVSGLVKIQTFAFRDRI